MREVSPKKALETYKSEIKKVKYLRLAFGRMRPMDVTKLDIYKYMEVRSESAPVGVNREIALLSAIMKKGTKWGALTVNPCTDIEYNQERPRARYVTDEEFMTFKAFLMPRNKLVAAYLDFKYITGLRTSDILRLKKSDLRENGIYLYIGKTKQKRIMRWSDALRSITEALIRSNWRPKNSSSYSINSDYLVHTRKGLPYSASGWRAIFSRLMQEAVKAKILEESFCEHDIRAKAGSDVTDLEKAKTLLVHSSSKVTLQHYRRRIEEIDPLY